ncbi:MAG: allantoinase AllB [Terrimicrobiaceae bacterium]|nr:allantoinase AllB [Terrimicrobiaceae bacterium]
MTRRLVIRAAAIPGREGLRDIVIEDGVIAEIPLTVSGGFDDEFDAGGGWVFPGFVDAHVHFNEPGREEWEGLQTGSRALAAGGGTVFVDMPLNSSPPVLDREQLDRKRAVAGHKSITDFALWGGICPGSVENIHEMADGGAVGFKAFLCPSGIDEFPASDPTTLRRGMELARQFRLPVSVHAEDPALLRPAGSDRSLRGFFHTRPKASEVSAIRLACELAGETGAKLHVVHVSCAEGLNVIHSAKKAGVDVTAETCPHYLLFDEDQAEKIGARAKCAPPLRSAADVDALWQALFSDRIDTLGSDHSPAPPTMKTGDDFFKIWGGISGCQHGLVTWLGELHHRRPDRLAFAADRLAAEPARRLQFGGKGRLEPGYDADLTFLEFGPPAPPQPALYRHPIHLYEFSRPRCRVHHVLRRGEWIVRGGRPVEGCRPGRFLQPVIG